MDKKQFEAQAKVLSNKRQSGQRPVNMNPPTVSGGVVRFQKPVERKQVANINPPSPAQIRRMKAEKIAEQRKQVMMINKNKNPTAVNNVQVFQMFGNNAAIQNDATKKDDKKKPPPKKKGCSGCTRRK